MSLTTRTDKPAAYFRNRAEEAAHEGKQGRRITPTYTEDLTTVGDTDDDNAAISYGTCDDYDTAVLPKRR